MERSRGSSSQRNSRPTGGRHAPRAWAALYYSAQPTAKGAGAPNEKAPQRRRERAALAAAAPAEWNPFAPARYTYTHQSKCAKRLPPYFKGGGGGMMQETGAHLSSSNNGQHGKAHPPRKPQPRERLLLTSTR